jgi:hypothetical protein
MDDDDWEPAPGEHPTWTMEEIENHPLFMTEVPRDGSNVHVEALQSVLYDYDSPDEMAANFKDQGNDALRRGLVDDAGIFYEKGLMSGCKNKTILSQLHSNLALVRYKQSRFPECVDECYVAIGLNPENVKGFYRGALASLKLDLYSQGLYFTKGGLDVDPENKELKDIDILLEDSRAKQLEARKKEEGNLVGHPKMKFKWRD